MCQLYRTRIVSGGHWSGYDKVARGLNPFREEIRLECVLEVLAERKSRLGGIEYLCLLWGYGDCATWAHQARVDPGLQHRINTPDNSFFWVGAVAAFHKAEPWIKSWGPPGESSWAQHALAKMGAVYGTRVCDSASPSHPLPAPPEDEPEEPDSPVYEVEARFSNREILGHWKWLRYYGEDEDEEQADQWCQDIFNFIDSMD